MSAIDLATIAELRALTADLAFPDTYVLLGVTSTPDDSGGSTDVEATAETGACSLTAGATRPEERVVADRQGFQAPYTIELPYATAATPGDRLTVNGTRTFEIGGVLKDGRWGITAIAVCEERG